MDIVNRLKELTEIVEGNQNVLAIFLDTQPNVREKAILVFKEKSEKIINRLEEMGEKGQAEDVKISQKQIERYLLKDRGNFQRSLILFATSNPEKIEVEHFQFPIDSNVVYGKTDALAQLQALKEKYPPSGIVIANKSDVTIYDLLFGEVTKETNIELEIETEEVNENEERTDVPRTRGNRNQNEGFKNRVNDRMRQTYSDIAKQINGIAKKSTWKTFLLVGEPDTTNYLKNSLQVKPTKIIHKNMSKLTSKEVTNLILAE